MSVLYPSVPNKVIYTNWRGETRERVINPIKYWFGKTEFHPKPQWFVKAIDLEKNEERDFALNELRPSRSNK